MTEEVESQEGKKEEQVVKLSSVEEEASTQGWVPKDQFIGDEHKWVEAGEFLRRGELFKKIEQVSKTAKDAQKTLAEFKAHYAKVKETEFQNALKALKNERRNAMSEGDFERVEAIEDRMESVKTEAATIQTEIKVEEIPELHPEVVAWVETNTWYSNDDTMRAFADAIAMQVNKRGVTGSALLKEVDAKVREAFPAKFKNPNRERPGAVEGASQKGRVPSQETFQLSEQETRIMNTFVRDGVMSKEQYIKDLKAVKGIK